MDCLSAITTRYSYRGMYLPNPIPRGDLRSILEAGLAAPSGCNQQTTSLIGVDDPALITKLGGLLKKPNFASAPAAVCVLSRVTEAYEGAFFHIQDYAAAIENMLLCITALGYASCWVEGYIKNATQICAQMAALLHVPDDLQLVAYLPVGKPAEDGAPAKKLPFAQRAFLNGYGIAEETV